MKKLKTNVLLSSLLSISLFLFAGIGYAEQSHSGGHNSTKQAMSSSSVEQHSSGSSTTSNPEPAQNPQDNHEMPAEEHSSMPGMNSNEMAESNGTDLEQSAEAHDGSGEGHAQNVSDEVNWPVVGSFIIINLLIIIAAVIAKPRRMQGANLKEVK